MLAGPERTRLLQAVAVLALFAMLRRSWTLPRLRALSRRLAHACRPTGAPPTPRDVLLALDRAARLLRAASCLPVALAACTLLERAGHPARLRVGLARSTDGRWGAHAWVELHGRVIVGGDAGTPRRHLVLRDVS